MEASMMRREDHGISPNSLLPPKELGRTFSNSTISEKHDTCIYIRDPTLLHGGTLSLSKSGGINLQSKGQAKNIKLVDDKREGQPEYRAQRARGAYIASLCQPEACFDLSVAAQQQNPAVKEIEALNKRLKWQIDHPERGLNYIPLNLETARVFVFVDGSFANNNDLSSQIGFVIILANENKNDDQNQFEIKGNIIHYSSTKCKRVTRSVLASEIYGM
ncbi:hypothetical protein K3495_g13214, partial [Podosphaera aphanis]